MPESIKIIPIRLNLKHIDQFSDECSISYLFGNAFEPAVKELVERLRALVALEAKPNNANSYYDLTGTGFVGSRRELRHQIKQAQSRLLDYRRQLHEALQRYLNSLSLQRAVLTLPDGSKANAYKAIASWVSGLPLEVTPLAIGISLGIPQERVKQGDAAYRQLMESFFSASANNQRDSRGWRISWSAFWQRFTAR
jgi:hypothetical protein